MKRYALYTSLFLFHVCGITAFYNLALGKSTSGWYFYKGNQTLFSTNKLTDGNVVENCEYYKGDYYHFYIRFHNKHTIKSIKLVFKGDISTNGTNIHYDGDRQDWPYYVYKPFQKDIPRTVVFDTQVTGQSISFIFLHAPRTPIEFELCEIEIKGCEVDHYGSDCKPCKKSENCEVCDVNNGGCYICKDGYTGVDCSIETENVAFQKNTWMSFWVQYAFKAPSHRLVDGNTKQPSCFDLLSGSHYSFDMYLLKVYNIKDVRLYFTIKGMATFRLKFTICPPVCTTIIDDKCYGKSCGPEHRYTEIQDLSASSSVIITPYLNEMRSDELWMSFTYSLDNPLEGLNSSFSICEVEVNACPRNHYSTPCRPCHPNCDKCNAEYCVCQVGYTGANCTEECSNDTYGANCTHSCGHCLNNSCDHVTGYCSFGCTEGWTSSKCEKACSPGYYGRGCTQRCSSHCITPYLCDRYNGSCIGGCASGWKTDTCDKGIDWIPSDVSVSYQGMTWRKEELDNKIRYDPAVTLICKFSLNSDEKLIYEITWFLDGKEVLNQSVDESSNYTAVITAHDFLRAEKKAGTEVLCRVGAKRQTDKFPCRFKEGNPFFAGIKILNPSIELERKGSEHVQLEMTIPFASESLYVNGVLYQVSDLNIHMTFQTDDSSECSGGGSSNQCEVNVKSFSYDEKHKYENGEWKQNISFPVYSKDTDGYVINRNMILWLKTGGTSGVGSKIFEHVALPNITIRVREGNEQWKGKSCGVRTDPHMYTFDGKSYECQIPGDFINYRNQPQLQWIQSKHHLCIPSYNGPWCVCAVAARAGRDVFVIDLCGENNLISYTLCEDNVLKVTKIYDRYYKIYFPTGTSLSIYIMEWRGHYNIDLEILPSAMDIGNADGLCGYFDGYMENDFRRRDSSIIDDISLTYPNAFSESWKIRDSENLFSGDSLVYNSLQSISTILVPRCTCTANGTTECAYNTFTPCNSNRGRQYNCNVQLVQNRRRKRDVPSVINNREPLIRKKRTISYVRNQTYSESVCQQAFENSAEYKTCKQYVTDLSNVTLSNCIEDIKMTGDENLTQIHVEAALQQCSTFVFLNATLQESEPEVTYTIQNLCPSNCSGHGICDGGNCTCDTGFGGSDCSFDLFAPPTITSVPGAGLCDLSITNCEEATIMGKYFFENMDSKCFLTVKQVNINQTEVRELQIERNLQERTLFEGFCPLSFDTNGIWTTEIKFNISNDGKRYSDTYEFIVYQSLCQEYHNESGNVYFTLKENFCYIDSICIRPLQNNSKNKCSYCNATSNQFNWTENETCGQTTSERMLTTMLNTVTESTVMSFTEREENYTSSSTTAAQEEKTLSQITGSLTTSQTEQASLVSNTLPEESSTLMSTDMPEIDTTDFTEMTESISKTYVDTTTGLSVTEAITLKPTFTSTSTTKASTTLKETTTITSKLTITTVITTEADLQTTPSFPPSLTEVNTQFISESTTKSTTNIETSTAQPSPTVSTKKSETSTIPSTAKLDTLQTTTIAETKSTISTETSQPVTTSEGRVGTTTSNDKGNTNDKSIQAQVRNTQLIVGASVSFVGIIIIMVIIGLVARKCRKPNKNARHQREDFGQLRNWRDLALAGKENTSTSQYDSNLSDPHIPHASLHHFKSQ